MIDDVCDRNLPTLNFPQWRLSSILPEAQDRRQYYIYSTLRKADIHGRNLWNDSDPCMHYITVQTRWLLFCLNNKSTLDLHACLHSGQTASASAGKDGHNAKTDIEQRKRICDKAAHARHTPYRTEHGTAAICTPRYRSACQEIAVDCVERECDANKRGQDKRKQTVAQYRSRSPDGECR